MFAVPVGYPWLDIEIGGGMASDYNHRVTLDSDDMPSMHLCDVGAGMAFSMSCQRLIDLWLIGCLFVGVGVGVNTLGYYMYHGGNNPHSTIHHDMDNPNTTLQESSFQPAGKANPMPSISYE